LRYNLPTWLTSL